MKKSDWLYFLKNLSYIPLIGVLILLASAFVLLEIDKRKAHGVPHMVVDKVECLDTCGYWVSPSDTVWMLNCTITSMKPKDYEDSLWFIEHHIKIK